MAGCEFPDREWIALRLRQAVKFWWSDCFQSLPGPLATDDLNPPHASPGGKNDGVAFVPDHKVVCAAFDFDCRLSEAAFAQRVRFKGKREDNDTSEHEPIDFGYFSKPRGFCLGDGEIQPMPYPTNDQDIFEHAVTNKVAVWHDVLVHRDDFMTWIIEAYPSCASLIPAGSSSIESLPVLETIYRTGASGRPTSKHLVDTELQRRAATGSLLPSLKREAESLEQWLKKEHPDAPRMTAKTIENSFRHFYNALRVSGSAPK